MEKMYKYVWGNFDRHKNLVEYGSNLDEAINSLMFKRRFDGQKMLLEKHLHTTEPSITTINPETLKIYKWDMGRKIANNYSFITLAESLKEAQRCFIDSYSSSGFDANAIIKSSSHEVDSFI